MVSMSVSGFAGAAENYGDVVPFSMILSPFKADIGMAA